MLLTRSQPASCQTWTHSKPGCAKDIGDQKRFYLTSTAIMR